MQATPRKKTRRVGPKRSDSAVRVDPPMVEEASRHEVVTFGRRLRELRKQKNWTLEHASKVTGVPVATLSRIANEKVSPTLDIVMRIAKGFSMSPNDFMFPQPKQLGEHAISITRKGQGRFAELPNLIYHPLHPHTRPDSMQSILVTLFAKRPEEYGPLTSHPGEEFLYVLDGTLEVMFEGGRSHTLEVGDSMLFHSGIRHGYISKGRNQAKFLIVTVSPDGAFDFGSYDAQATG